VCSSGLVGEEITNVGFAVPSADVLRLLQSRGHGTNGTSSATNLDGPELIRQVEPAVFDWMSQFLRLLDGEGASAERLRVFEIGLLRDLGFGPVLDTCAACGGQAFEGRAPAEVAFRWDPDGGGAICTACARGGRPLQPAVREALIRLARTPLADATAESLPADVNRDCREALLEIINHHVSGPLKTVEFIAKVARAGGPP